jgi:hypothetical protein
MKFIDGGLDDSTGGGGVLTGSGVVGVVVGVVGVVVGDGCFSTGVQEDKNNADKTNRIN